nr:hypothetical protein [Coleopteran tombus-related virus]
MLNAAVNAAGGLLGQRPPPPVPNLPIAQNLPAANPLIPYIAAQNAAAAANPPAQPEVPMPSTLLENPPVLEDTTYVENPQFRGSIMRMVNGTRRYDEAEQIQLIVDMLAVKTTGRPIDANYKSYCAYLVGQYMDESRIVQYSTRRKLLEEAMKQHMEDRKRPSHIYTASDIAVYRAVNDNLQGNVKVRNPWFPWIVTTTGFNDHLNSTLPISAQPPYSWWTLLGYGALIAGGAYLMGRYVMPLLSQNPIPTTTIQKVAQQPLQQLQSDIVQEQLIRTIQDLSIAVTDMSENFSVIRNRLVGGTIVKQCTHLLSAPPIWLRSAI